jgi:hypothetical protein
MRANETGSGAKGISYQANAIATHPAFALAAGGVAPNF